MAMNLCKKCGERVEGDSACPSCGTSQTVTARRTRPRAGRYSPGECIDGKYEVIMTLGTGGMGELYKVRHLHLNDFRAVKVLRADQVSDETQKRRFLREAKVAASIKHDNLASLYDFSSIADGSFYMVEEYIDGITIAQHMRRGGKFSVRDVVAVAEQVLSGLSAMHEGGIIHRDISPDNLMLARMQGRTIIKIIDMGIAKPVSESGEGLTSAGFFIGKPHYASPEQMRMIETTERIDHRTDLYSLDIVLYEMIVGRVPFVADTPIEYIIKQATEEIVAISRSGDAPLVPADVEEFVLRLLRINRNDRFADADAAREALSRVGVPRPWLIGTRLMPTVHTLVPPEASADQRRAEEVRNLPPTTNPVATEINAIPAFASQHGKTPVLAREGDPDSGEEEPEEITEEFKIPKMKPPATPPPAKGVRTVTDVPSNSPRTLDEVAPSSPATLHDHEVPPPLPVAPVVAPRPASVAALPLKAADPPMVRHRKPAGAAALGLAAVVLILLAGIAFLLLRDPVEETPPAVVREGESRRPVQAQAGKLEVTEPGPTSALETSPPVLTGPPAVTQSAAPLAIVDIVDIVETPSTKRDGPASETSSRPEPKSGTAGRTQRPVEKRAPKEEVPPAPVVEIKPDPPPPPPIQADVREGDLVTMGEGVVDAKVVKLTPPVYPAAARLMRAEGNVRVNVLISHEGKVEEVAIVGTSGIEAMDQAALIAARKSRYLPATKNGIRVRIWKAMNFQFRP